MQHCFYNTRSDWIDVGPVVQYLRGPLKANIIDFKASDFSGASYFEEPAQVPTWVAAALVAWL